MDTPGVYASLDDAMDDFMRAQSAETAALFVQSDICVAACSAASLGRMGTALGEPLSEEAVLRALGERAKRGRSTMYARVRVGRLFPPDLVIDDLFPHGVRDVPPDITWSHYELCSRLYSQDTPMRPYEWLHYAAINGLSVRRLEMEIKARAQEPPAVDSAPDTWRPRYVLDAARCILDAWDGHFLTVICEEPPGEQVKIQPGAHLIVTVLLEAVAPGGPLKEQMTGPALVEGVLL